IGLVMKDEAMKKRGKEATDATKQITTLIHRLPPDLVAMIAKNDVNEAAVFESAVGFLEREYGLKVKIVKSDESTHPKARQALPFKPAILIE
ncbi:MAG: hypothetical protein J5788_01390, partial [Methanomicrobium sp.]|nr:hypothetical protein [Methanomicrobium sp.]